MVTAESQYTWATALGVEQASCERLQALASDKGVRVIEGALRGRDPEAYFKEELQPPHSHSIVPGGLLVTS